MCPEEGTTPLHDTLSNEHLEVAKLLLEKGGVELLYVNDKNVCSARSFVDAYVFYFCRSTHIYLPISKKMLN